MVATRRSARDASASLNAAELHALQAWLVSEDLAEADDARLAGELGRGLCAAGLPVDRLALLVGTLHPEVPARVVCWRPGAPVEVYEAEHGVETRLGREPIRLALERGEAVVVRAGVSQPAGPPQALGALGGGADQVVLPLAVAEVPLSVLWLATERPAGFVGAELAALGELAPRLRTACELRALRRTELPLLDSYCGRPTARRVLAQHLRAGRPESLEAAWLQCRLGGDPALAAHADPEAQLERLGRFVASLADIAGARGGLVLKAFDDGALAVFCQEEAGFACAAALDAARALRAAAPAHAAPEIALHYGAMSYGGLRGRPSTLALLGPAPALLGRVVTACAALRRPLLLTAAFARRLAPGSARPLTGRPEPGGEFELHVLAEDA
jgi:adenylate cyclase